MNASTERPIRIAHVITKMAVGGAQESAILTCAELDRANFHQVLISGVEVDEEGSLHDDARTRGVEIVDLPSLVRAVDPRQDMRAVRDLMGHFRSWRPDVVHTHSSKAGFLGRVAARLARVPVVVHSVHGWSFHDDMSTLGRQVVVAAERVAARMTDALVVESSTDLPKGLGRGIGTARQYALIRNGIDLRRFRIDVDRGEVRSSLGVSPTSLLLGTVGRLAEQKHPLLMVEAFARLAVDHPRAEFVWVGDGPLRGEVERRAEALGIGDRFRLVGVRRDVPAVLQALDAFVLSSRWEGLPRTITEAMASGVPVVATKVDGTQEAIQDGVSGLLVESGDEGGLAAAMARLLEEPELGPRLADAGRRRAELFSQDVMIKDLSELYRRLTRGEPAPRGHRPLKVIHVITGLEYGGAERQLQLLLGASDPAAVTNEVISLTGRGPIGRELEDSGVPVLALGLEGGWRAMVGVRRLRRHLARAGADVVQTWLYHGDVIGGLAARSARLPVVWNVRMSWMDERRTKRGTMAMARAATLLSRWVPCAIVYNSDAGRRTHEAHGFRSDRGIVIGNAVDTQRFGHKAGLRDRARAELGLGSHESLVVTIGRFDPQKGHDVLFEAMTAVAARKTDVRVALAGPGTSAGEGPVESLVGAHGFRERTLLLGPVGDVRPLLHAADVLVSASMYGEGVPNVVVEAVCCETPVVGTDVGDIGALLGPGDRLVPPGSSDRLAQAVVEILGAGSRDHRSSGRPASVLTPGELAASYQMLYDLVVRHGGAGHPDAAS